MSTLKIVAILGRLSFALGASASFILFVILQQQNNPAGIQLAEIVRQMTGLSVEGALLTALSFAGMGLVDTILAFFLEKRRKSSLST
jgi:hypothetical protein